MSTNEDFAHTWMNVKTGELRHNVSRIISAEQDQSIHIYKQRKEYFHNLNENFGEFFFYKYDKLLQDIQYQMATAFRFLYVCSKADRTHKVIAYDNYVATNPFDFTYIFNKPRTTSIDFYHDLANHELIYQDTDGNYRVNDNYFAKDFSNDEFKRHSVRVFNIALQDLYNQLTSSEHVFGGELLKLVPYMNVHTNVLCHYIEEADINYMEPLTKEEIQTILRDDSDYGRKLRLKMEKFMLRDEPVLGKFAAMGETHYIINPRLFYRGNNINDLKATMQNFDICKAQTKQRTMKRKEVN